MKTILLAMVVMAGMVIPASGTNYYVDFVGGNDASAGTSTGTAWQHIKGMAGASGAAAAHACTTGDTYIFKAGVTWTNAALPWKSDCSGVAGVTFKADATWTTGIVTSVTITGSGQNCSSLTVGFTGGGGTNAAATAQFQTSGPLGGNLQFVTVTNGGSGYTSNPTVTFSGSCTTFPSAVAHIDYAIFDASGTTWDGTNGCDPALGPVCIYGNSAAVTMSGLEFRGMRVPNAYAGGIIPLVQFVSNGGSISNVYAHNIGPVSIANSGTPSSDKYSLFDINQGTSNTATVNASFFNNYEIEISTNRSSPVACGWSNSVAQNYTDAPCGAGYGLRGATTVTNSYFNDIRGQLYAPALSGLDYHGNTLWNTPHDCCNQHEDTLYFFGGGKIYNNVIHDMVAGAASLYVELTNNVCPSQLTAWTTYVFNNVIWDAGDSTPPIGFTAEFYNCAANATPTMYAINNTILGRGGSVAQGTGQCINWGQQQSQSAAIFNLYNNHCISTQAAAHWYESNGTSFGTVNGQSSPNSGATQAIVDAANVIQTPTNATSQGYVLGNQFAPTLNTNVTETFSGTDETALCATVSQLCTSINNIARPNGSAWKGGAYILAGAPTPTAALTATPAVIKTGTSSTLASTCTNTDTAAIDHGVGAVSNTTDSKSVSPTVTTTYTLTCTPTVGSPVTATATVTIGGVAIGSNVKFASGVAIQ